MASSEKRLSREEEERLWMISIAPLVPFLVIVGVYFVDLASNGGIPSFQILMIYILLLIVLVFVTGAGIYEFAESFKVKKSLNFRVKRFSSRTLFASVAILYIFLLWQLFTFIFSSFLRTEYILVMSLLTMAFTFCVLFQNPKTKRLIRKLTQEES